MGLKLYALLLGVWVMCFCLFTIPTLCITAFVLLLAVVWVFWSVCFAVGQHIINIGVGLVFWAFGK